MAYTSPSLAGIQAAVSVGIGVSILPEVAILPEHRVLKTKDGFPSITNTEVVLVAAPNASPATRRLAELLREFMLGCRSTQAGVILPKRSGKE
jgi:DNA-binding transcriptional LysR family regulator